MGLLVRFVTKFLLCFSDQLSTSSSSSSSSSSSIWSSIKLMYNNHNHKIICIIILYFFISFSFNLISEIKPLYLVFFVRKIDTHDSLSLSLFCWFKIYNDEQWMKTDDDDENWIFNFYIYEKKNKVNCVFLLLLLVSTSDKQC